MHLSCRLPALLGLTALALPLSAQAQGLILGDMYDGSKSGTAILTDTGTAVSGSYIYYDGGTGLPVSLQNNYGGASAYGSSMITMTGGSIYDLNLSGSSTASISGGSIRELNTPGYSAVDLNISGGSIFEVFSNDATTASVSGGSITGLEFFGSSTGNVSGGSITYLVQTESSRVNVTGGSFDFLSTENASVMDLFGTGFSETLVKDLSIDHQQYMVTGTLLDGTPLNAIYDYYDNSTLEFNGVPVNGVPEASTTLSFSLLLALGAGGLVIARRKKAQANF